MTKEINWWERCLNHATALSAYADQYSIRMFEGRVMSLRFVLISLRLAHASLRTNPSMSFDADVV